MRIYPVKENPIGSAVREIIWYKQTDIVLLCIIDWSARVFESIGENVIFWAAIQDRLLEFFCEDFLYNRASSII